MIKSAPATYIEDITGTSLLATFPILLIPPIITMPTIIEIANPRIAFRKSFSGITVDILPSLNLLILPSPFTNPSSSINLPPFVSISVNSCLPSV